MACMQVDQVSEDGAQGVQRHVRVDFRCAHERGVLQISSSYGFACDLAANVLDENPDALSDSIEGIEALLELGAILGSEVAMALGGSNTIHQLGSPEGGEETLQPDDDVTICWLDYGGETLRALLRILPDDTDTGEPSM